MIPLVISLNFSNEVSVKKRKPSPYFTVASSIAFEAPPNQIGG